MIHAVHYIPQQIHRIEYKGNEYYILIEENKRKTDTPESLYDLKIRFYLDKKYEAYVYCISSKTDGIDSMEFLKNTLKLDRVYGNHENAIGMSKDRLPLLDLI